jgi:hypothetical protein
MQPTEKLNETAQAKYITVLTLHRLVDAKLPDIILKLVEKVLTLGFNALDENER